MMMSNQLTPRPLTQKKEIATCPICGASGSLAIKDCKDQICGLPGQWSFYKCHQCSSLWLNPRPVDDAIPSLYTDDYHFTHSAPSNPLQEPPHFVGKIKFAVKLGIWQQAFGYSGLTQYTSLPIFTWLGHVISYFPGQSQRAGYLIRFLCKRSSSGQLLEVGSGNGSFLWLMRELGWDVKGIEPDSNAVQAAAAKGITTLHTDIENAELEPSYYDAIVLHHVAEHLPYPKAALEKLTKSLKKGGKLISISPNPTSSAAIIFKENWYGLADTPRHLALPSPQGYKQMLENLGMKVKVTTTMQIAFWMYRESLSIHRTGRVSQYTGSLLPKIATVCVSFLLPIFPYLGEEVICVAIKQK